MGLQDVLIFFLEYGRKRKTTNFCFCKVCLDYKIQDFRIIKAENYQTFLGSSCSMENRAHSHSIRLKALKEKSNLSFWQYSRNSSFQLLY